MSGSETPDSNEWTRRQLIAGGGALAAAFLAGGSAGALAGGPRSSQRDENSDDNPAPADSDKRGDLSTWQGVRAQFIVDPDLVHMAGLLLAAHPRLVREAIARHRRGLDENPTEYLHDHWGLPADHHDQEGEQWAMQAAGRYLQIHPANVALTRSTTMGLVVVYNGIQIGEDQEVLTGHWNHWATRGTLDYRAQKAGFDVRRAVLFEDIQQATVEQLAERLVEDITPKTRVVAVTWVHSNTGLKLPVAEIGRRIAELNEARGAGDRILYCVDGVHGFGVEDVAFEDLNCDFFVAGCHKWLFGPRGTGIIAAAPNAWRHAIPTAPSFSGSDTQGRRFSPGGFHAYEHRFAINEAFEFHMDIGKERVEQRIHALTDHLVEGLAEMDHVDLRTPIDPELRAGIVTFEVDGHSTWPVLEHLRAHDIIGSTTPGSFTIPRLAPGLLNDHAQIDKTLRAISELR
jgi:isopenicillin-N epimerase